MEFEVVSSPRDGLSNRFSTEKLAWGLLIAVSLVMRLAGLGTRALSHDESLHALYSWYLSEFFSYEHDPMMHGPLLFHLNAGIYRVLGISDFTARLLPAFAGTGCVAMLWLYRRWLGRRGAFAAAVLVSLNPGLLAYSRYLRNDIYICLFTLIMVWAILRYVTERNPAYLFWLSVGLALCFACKEVSFIHGTVLGVICVGFTAVACHQNRWKITYPSLTAIPWGDCAVVLLTLALPFAAGLVHQLFGWDPLDTRSALGQARTARIALSLGALSTLIALVWFGFTTRLRTWIICFAAFWSLQALLYSTLFSNWGQGMSSSVAGSLGYWLAQHEVQRGSDDPLFYLSLHLIYEPLLIVAACMGLKRIPNPARAVFGFWLLGNFAIYSWAGERMPWLMIHISLPLCLLAGPTLADYVQHLRRARQQAVTALLALLCLHYTVNSIRANGPNAASQAEPLYFAHGGEHLKTAIGIVERQLQKHPDKHVLIHPDFSWPLAWYFREKNASYADTIDPLPDYAVVALVPLHMRKAYVGTEWTPRGTFVMIHWPRQDWHAFTEENFKNLLQEPEARRRLFRYYLFRDIPDPGPGEFPQPNSFLLLSRNPAP
ncbi:MAG: TIGR03663 family protein [Verrucomicrobia bacterium]|nr:TIGR03663 family protein [Verrucomicrobiota bacterium]MCH8514355.1 TIGR03663 family protein [Kiritimatiellia bacterium]